MSILVPILAAGILLAIAWYFILRRAQRRAYADGWNVGHKNAMQQYELGRKAGFSEGIAAWARVSREFTVPKSEVKK